VKDITKRASANVVKSSTKRRKLNNSSTKKAKVPKVSQSGNASKAEVQSILKSLTALKSEEHQLEDQVRKMVAQVTDVDLMKAELTVLKKKVDVYKVQSNSLENELNKKKKLLQKQKATVRKRNEKVIQLKDNHVIHKSKVDEYIEKAGDAEALLKACNEELQKYKEDAEALGKNKILMQTEVEE